MVSAAVVVNTVAVMVEVGPAAAAEVANLVAGKVEAGPEGAAEAEMAALRAATAAA